MEYINSPFPYAGCKYDLLEHLDRAIPEGERLFDVFGGSGAVGVNLSYRFKYVCVTDILRDLVMMHRAFQSDEPDAIIEKLRELSSKEPEKYAELRNAYNGLEKHDPERGYRLYGLILSCTNNLMRFNLKGGFNQTCGKRQLTAPKEKEIRAWCERLRSDAGKGVMFGYGPFDRVLDSMSQRVPSEGTVVYLDPPYSNTEAGYNSTWTVNDDDKLSAFMLSTRTTSMSFPAAARTARLPVSSRRSRPAASMTPSRCRMCTRPRRRARARTRSNSFCAAKTATVSDNFVYFGYERLLCTRSV